jgi:hypothetical protein
LSLFQKSLQLGNLFVQILVQSVKILSIIIQGFNFRFSFGYNQVNFNNFFIYSLRFDLDNLLSLEGLNLLTQFLDFEL